MIKQQDLKEIGKEKKKGMYRLEFNKNKIKIALKEIWKVIQFKSWDTTDNTYRPICNRLRELGYEIIN